MFRHLRFVSAVSALSLIVAGCDFLSNSLSIFLVKFFYAGSGVASLIVPAELRDAATVYNSPLSVAGLQAATRLTAKGITTNPTELLTYFADKSKYGVNLKFGLGADNSGNSDSAYFPVTAGLNLFMQEKVAGNKVGAELPAFGVSPSKIDTIDVVLPITLAQLPSASVQAALKGDSIPYWVTGSVGYSLKSPITGNEISNHTSEMDLATDKVATRPDDAQLDSFLKLVAAKMK
jgi:hypothetical protein